MNVTAHPHNRATDAALRIYGTVLDQVRADRLVSDAMKRVGTDLFIQDERIDLTEFRSVRVCAVGKAALPMANAALEVLDGRVDGGLVVTKHGHTNEPCALPVIEAGHPMPDEDSLRAGEEMLRIAESCGGEDFVLFLLSGGASALMEAPSVPFEDLLAANEYLLRSGAPISVVNALRTRISKIKGGGLARAFDPANVVCLVLSDVIGNNLESIGSGPLTAPRNASDPSVRYAYNEQLPASVRKVLLAPRLEPMPLSQPVRHYVIGSVSLAVQCAMRAAEELGIQAVGYSDPMQGEAVDMAAQIAEVGRRRLEAHGDEPFCLVFGGETTVTFEVAGKGGRCQEMAVAVAPRLGTMPGCAFLAAGTDGTDGPTEAAGATCDPQTVHRAAQDGQSVERALADHASYRFLEASNNLVITGPTGSNVNDIALFVSIP